MMWRYCDTCDLSQPVADESVEQSGFEERAVDVHVTTLECGHEIVRPTSSPRR